MTPLELLARLAALIPPPRHPLVRFHGAFAPRSSWRCEVVPKPRDPVPKTPHAHAPKSPPPATTACAQKAATRCPHIARRKNRVARWERLRNGALVAASRRPNVLAVDRPRPRNPRAPHPRRPVLIFPSARPRLAKMCSAQSAIPASLDLTASSSHNERSVNFVQVVPLLDFLFSETLRGSPSCNNGVITFRQLDIQMQGAVRRCLRSEPKAIPCERVRTQGPNLSPHGVSMEGGIGALVGSGRHGQSVIGKFA